MKKINSSKAISLGTCIILIMISLSLCFSQYNEYLLAKENANKSINNIMYFENDYIYTILKENIAKSNKILDLKNNDIQQELIKKYTKDEYLIGDIINPKDNSILSSVFDKFLNNLYINVDNKNNRSFVMSTNNIIWNRTNNTNITNKDKTILDLSSFNSFVYNNILANEAIVAIKSIKYNDINLIYWQCNISNSDTITDMNIEELYETYKKYGLEELKNYELLVPSYITNTGDIFGKKDVSSNGLSRENYKLIIVQRINIYDALIPYEGSLNNFTNQINNIKSDLYRISLSKVRIIFECVLILLTVFCISAILQNKLLKTTDSILIKDKE